MNALVVSFSKFGNTRKIAQAIAETLAPAGSVRVLDMEQLTASELNGLDLVVMGCPTHRMNLPESVRIVFKTLPRRVLRNTAIAAFDTSYRMSWWLARLTAARRLERQLCKLGGKRIVPPQTFHVEASQGPLFRGEIERAKAWAETILAPMDQR